MSDVCDGNKIVQSIFPISNEFVLETALEMAAEANKVSTDNYC